MTKQALGAKLKEFAAGVIYESSRSTFVYSAVTVGMFYFIEKREKEEEKNYMMEKLKEEEEKAKAKEIGGHALA